MPSVCDGFPILIAAKKIERILSIILANSQARSRTHQRTGNNLLTISRMSVPFINRRIENNFCATYFFRNTYHKLSKTEDA